MPSPYSSNRALIETNWTSCVHEASHTITALAIGREIIEVWASGGEGLCRHRGRSNAVICLGGYAGEWRLDRPGEIPTASDFAGNLRHEDVRNAAACIGTTDGELLRAAWLEAKRILDLHWPEVERVAEALMRHGRLSGAEVHAIWHEAQAAA